MTGLDHYAFEQLRALDDEAAFFAQMGRFFASATVRRECGGYPLNDGPRHLWFIARHQVQARVMGFISVEHLADRVHIRDAYLRSEARQQGLFRELRRQVLEYIDGLGQPCTTSVPKPCVERLLPHGFHIQSTRGNWVTLKRSANATSSESDQPGRNPVP